MDSLNIERKDYNNIIETIKIGKNWIHNVDDEDVKKAIQTGIICMASCADLGMALEITSQNYKQFEFE